MFEDEGLLLRIFVGESDKHEGEPLYEWILKAARQAGLAGGTVFRGLAGYGANSLIHTAKVLRLSEDLPMLIEIIDTEDKIHAFLPIVDAAMTEGVATLEKIRRRTYSPRT